MLNFGLKQRLVLPGYASGELKFLSYDGVTDTVGESGIIYQSGDASTWATTAVWGFEYTAELAAVDTALGGGVLFTGTTPIKRTYAVWFGLFNKNYAWIGKRGVALYSTSQVIYCDRILRLLNGTETIVTPFVQRSGFEYDTFSSVVGSMSGTTDGSNFAIAGVTPTGITTGDVIRISYNATVTGVCNLQERNTIIGAPTLLKTITNGYTSFERTVAAATPVLTVTYDSGKAGSVSITNFSVIRISTHA